MAREVHHLTGPGAGPVQQKAPPEPRGSLGGAEGRGPSTPQGLEKRNNPPASWKKLQVAPEPLKAVYAPQEAREARALQPPGGFYHNGVNASCGGGGVVRVLEQTVLATITSQMPQQDMLSLGIHPRILQPATFPPFDLYAPPENGNGFRLFRAAGEPVYLNTWQKLDREGVELLYIRSRDRARCLEYVEQHLPALLEDNALPDGHLAQWVYLVAGQAMEELFRDPDSTPRYHRVRRLVAAILDVMETDRFCAQHMLDSAPVSYSTHTHCVNMCVLLTNFARNVLGVRDRSPLTDIALGGILHDIGKVMVPAAILRKRGELTRAELAKIRQHPQDSVEIARPFLRHRVIAQRIMAQHHENADGDGYPEGRSGQSIHMFARVARLADTFDALTSDRPYGEAADQYQALNTMAVEMRGAFDGALLRKFIRYAAAAFRRDSAFVLQGGETAEGEPASAAIVAGPAFGLETWEESVKISKPGDAWTEEADIAPFLRHRLNAIEGLMSQGNERVALMGGILNALQETVAGYLRGDVRTTHSGAQPLRTRTARLAAVEPVRVLFPLVWQLDEWRESFALPGDESPDAACLREDMLGCLGGFRADVAEVLRKHHVEIIESPDETQPSLRVVDASAEPSPENDLGVRVQRVGFLFRDGPEAEILEPIRVAARAALRKAG